MKKHAPTPDDQVRAIHAEDLAREESNLAGIEFSIRSLLVRKTATEERIEWLRTKVGEWKPAATIISTNVPGLKEGPDSLRARIRQIMDALPNGAKPRDVLNILKKQGYEFNGKTDPATRISSELWRMAKVDDVIRRDGMYFPVAKGG